MAITSFKTVEPSVLVSLSMHYLLSICPNFHTWIFRKEQRRAMAIRIFVDHTQTLTFEKSFSQVNSGHKTHKGYLTEITEILKHVTFS